MLNAHRGLGEGLFVVYLVVMVVIFVLGRRGGSTPAWLIGVSHALLAVQVALGVLLLATGHSVVWYHPVLGIAAFLAIGLAAPLRKRLGTTNGLVALFAILALLTLVARMTATM